jgi:hypothetical protein
VARDEVPQALTDAYLKDYISPTFEGKIQLWHRLRVEGDRSWVTDRIRELALAWRYTGSRLDTGLLQFLKELATDFNYVLDFLDACKDIPVDQYDAKGIACDIIGPLVPKLTFEHWPTVKVPNEVTTEDLRTLIRWFHKVWKFPENSPAYRKLFGRLGFDPTFQTLNIREFKADVVPHHRFNALYEKHYNTWGRIYG